MRPAPSRRGVFAACLVSAVSLGAAALAAPGGPPAGGARPAPVRTLANRAAPVVGFTTGGSFRSGVFGSGVRGADAPTVGFGIGGVTGGAYGAFGAPGRVGHGAGYGGYGTGLGYGGWPYGSGQAAAVEPPARAAEFRWPTTIGIAPPPVRPPAIYVIGASRNVPRARRVGLGPQPMPRVSVAEVGSGARIIRIP